MSPDPLSFSHSTQLAAGIYVVMAAGHHVLPFVAVVVVLCSLFVLKSHTLLSTHQTRIRLSECARNAAGTARSPGFSTPEAKISAQRLDLKLDVDFWISYARQQANANSMSVSAECDAQLGLGFLEKWANDTDVLCGSASASGSRVQCFAYPVKHKGLACISHNIQLNTTAFMGAGPSIGTADHMAYLPDGAAGSVRLACAWNSSSSVWARTQQKEETPWFTKAYAKVTTAQLQAACDAATRTIHHPVLFVSRIDPTNPYHHTQSLVQVFLTLAVLAANKSSFPDVQVFVADHFAEGPYMEIYRRLSYPHPVVNLKQVASSNETICIGTSVQAHAVPPGSAFLGYEGVGQEHSCPSVLLLAFSHWLRYILLGSLHLPQPAPSKSSAAAATAAENVLVIPKGPQRLKVLFVSRSWFERSMAAGGGLTGWQQQRLITPDEEAALVQAVQKVVLDWNAAACAPPVFGWWQVPKPTPPQQNCKHSNVSFDFQVAELSVMDFYPDQALALTETAVLIAAHGAALANQILMRPHRGAVVEIWLNQYHYINQGYMLGHKHFKSGRRAAELASNVREAMDYVATKY